VHHQGMATAQLNIGGMTCGGCVRSVTKKLSSVGGVASADVNLEAAKATVEYDEARTNPANLIAAIKQIGFEASEA
jgi:copper chaperone